MIKRFFIIILFFFSSFSFLIGDDKVKILLKIENEIITNLDIKKEKQYLLALNSNLSRLNDKEITKFAKNSIINEKIKYLELIKYFNLEKKADFMQKIIENFHKRLGINSNKEFKIFLSKYGLELNEVEKKLKIETLWNQLIYDKYINQVNIDKDELMRKIEKKKNEKLSEFYIKEILFNLKNNETVEIKYAKIKEKILKDGFENAANIYSVSETNKYGGEIGWVKETQLDNNILKSLNKTKIGETTQPLFVGTGYLILKKEKKREIMIKFDVEKEYKRVLAAEQSKKLNQYSNIYFKKVKQKLYISEL